jgi:hypothetical protein
MWELYLPLCRIRRLAFYRGINTVPRAFVCSFLALCDRTPSFASISCSLLPPSTFPPLPPYFDLSAHGGKEPSPSYGCVDPFLGDGEEVGGTGARWSPVTENESGPTGVESAADQPPGADASRRLHGELRRLP